MKRPLQPLTLLLAVLALAFAGWHLATHAAPPAPGRTAHGSTSVPAHTDAVKPHAKTKSRGASDYLHVDNQTGYTIDIYIDGRYKGTIAELGDLYLYNSKGGEHTVEGYAINTSLHWEPTTFTAPYTWKLGQ